MHLNGIEARAWCWCVQTQLEPGPAHKLIQTDKSRTDFLKSTKATGCAILCIQFYGDVNPSNLIRCATLCGEVVVSRVALCAGLPGFDHQTLSTFIKTRASCLKILNILVV